MTNLRWFLASLLLLAAACAIRATPALSSSFAISGEPGSVRIVEIEARRRGRYSGEYRRGGATKRSEIPALPRRGRRISVNPAWYPAVTQKSPPTVVLAWSQPAGPVEMAKLELRAPPRKAPAEGERWFKGNTHTHTLNSDGDSSPSVVARWYRDHGYDFLVLSDHNFHTRVDVLQEEIDRENSRAKKPPFLLIPGEEVTDKHEKAEIHVNALDSSRLVGAQGGSSRGEVLQRCIDAVRSAGGVPAANHPNFGWSLSADDLAAAKGLRHFEVYNGHPDIHNWGGGGSPSLEEMWDDLLTRGVRLFGLAVDDAHHFQAWGQRRSNPGRGWIMVHAREPTREAIRAAFERGDFYASTGVELERIDVSDGILRLAIRPRDDAKYTTHFIARGGRVARRDVTLEPSCRIEPGDGYLRARVVSSAGEYAWTQPVFED